MLKINKKQFDEFLLRRNDKDFILQNLDLSNLDSYLAGYNLGGIKFEKVVFAGLSLDDSRLSFGKFTNCIFDNCSFMGTKTEYATFTESSFKNVDFNRAMLSSSRFLKCNFAYSKLFLTELNDTEFNECDLFKTSFHCSKINKTTELINCKNLLVRAKYKVDNDSKQLMKENSLESLERTLGILERNAIQKEKDYDQSMERKWEWWERCDGKPEEYYSEGHNY